MKKIIILFFVLLIVCQLQTFVAQAQSLFMNYQGSLKDGGAAANGNYDFEFQLFDAPTGGTFLGVAGATNVQVTNGVFTQSFGFGSFTGPDRYLEVHVRRTGSGDAFTILTPRELIKSAPYAIKSLTADNSTNALQLGGVSANQYVLTGDARLSDARNPLPNSSNYIQNRTNPQTSSNFNISGTGNANIFNATQFNLSNFRVLSILGTNNLFAGALAGQSNTTGNGNSFVGTLTGQSNTTGSSNTLLGSFANVESSDLTNSTAIGAKAFVSQSNSLVLGSINGVNNATADTKVGIGTNSPTERLNVVGNGLFSGTLTGDSLFAVNKVGIGTTAPAKSLHIKGAGDQEIMLESSDTGGIKWTLQSSDGASGGRFEIIDRNANSSRMTILSNGFVGIGTTAPSDRLQVNGTIRVSGLGSAGSTSLCRNANDQISTCSSSIRYKQNVNPFSSGLSLIKRLRPVSFNWKANNQADLGLVAEEVKEVEPLLTTFNDNGEVEGVKYDRIGVVLVNAVQEQQEQIEAQQKQIDGQKEIISEQQQKLSEAEKQLVQQRSEIDALKILICSQNQTAQICQPKN